MGKWYLRASRAILLGVKLTYLWQFSSDAYCCGFATFNWRKKVWVHLFVSVQRVCKSSTNINAFTLQKSAHISLSTLNFNWIQFINRPFESISISFLTAWWGVCIRKLFYILFVLKHFFSSLWKRSTCIFPPFGLREHKASDFYALQLELRELSTATSVWFV